MPKTLNNEYLRNMAGAPSGKRLLNNDYLKMIVEGGGGGGGSAPAGPYKAGGSITASGLTSSLLTAANEGKVYNLSDELTITSSNASLFTGVEAGQTYPAGTNVAVIDNNGSYRFDVMSGFVDLSDYAPLDSPELTGTPTAPTATLGTDTDQIATTAFVRQEIDDYTVPTMSPTVKGGAKLGTGLEVTDGTLSVNTTASGDGSTAGPILSLSAKGWAEQDTTTGKNLLDASGIDSQTKNGITFTVQSDGSIKVTGTATEAARVSASISISLAGAYILGRWVGTASGTVNAAILKTYAGAQIVAYIDSQGTSTGYFSSEMTVDEFAIFVAAGATVDATFYPQLELGSTATEYEPYSGGAPSPSPSFPQEIRVASGRNLLKGSDTITEDCLFPAGGTDEILYPGTSKSAKTSASWDGPYLHIGEALTRAGAKVGDTATLSIRLTVTSATFVTTPALQLYRVTAASKEADFGAKTLKAGSWVTLSVAFTVTEYSLTSTTARFECAGNTSYYLIWGAPQLTLGSTPQPYLPYGYVGMEAQGRNLLNPAMFGSSSTKSGITYTNNGDGSVTIKGTATAYNAYYLLSNTQDWSKIRDRVVALSSDTALPNGMSLGMYNSSWKSIGRLTGSHMEITFTATDASYLYFDVTNGATVDVTIRPMLNEGSIALPYEPYYHSTTPIPLPSRGWVASLPDGTADTLTLDGAGKVTWEEKTDEVVLDGSSGENWYAYNNGATCGSAIVDSIIAPNTSNSTVSNLLCTRFRAITPNDTWDGNLGISIAIASAANKLRISDGTNSMTAAAWTAWLSTHPVTVLYQLAASIIEERGYVEMPSVPVGAEISIPELDDLGVKYCVDASARDLAMMWYDRARGEYADRLDGLDDDLVDTYGEIISTNARIDTVSMDEDYDRQALNGTYAGRNIQTILGTNSFDATISALHSRIASANFSGLRVGDFLNVDCGEYGTVRFDIAHFDPYYRMGQSAMGHHIAFVAHTPIALPSGDAYGTGTNNTYLAWNTTNTNQGTEAENCPYMCSHLHDWEINKLLPAMPTSLTNNLIDRGEYLETRYAAGSNLTVSKGRAWKQLGKLWSLSEMEVYGAVVWGTPGQSVGIDRQFDIFRSIHSQLHGERTPWWLRTPSGVSASAVSYVDNVGIVNTVSALQAGIRSRNGFLLG